MEFKFAERVHRLNAAHGDPHGQVPKRTYTPNEIQAVLGLSSTRVYALLKNAPFEVVKSGQHYFISKVSFDAWFAMRDKEVAEYGN